MLDRALGFMGHARDHIDRAATGAPHILHLVIPGDGGSVRRALSTIVDALRHMGVSVSLRGEIEIALAEALNNIVEHAFADLPRGVIEITLERRDDSFAVEVIDDGRPMPRGLPPCNATPVLDGQRAELPEGGFGWHLIRALTEQLSYSHACGRNRLTFLVQIPPRARPN